MLVFSRARLLASQALELALVLLEQPLRVQPSAGPPSLSTLLLALPLLAL